MASHNVLLRKESKEETNSKRALLTFRRIMAMEIAVLGTLKCHHQHLPPAVLENYIRSEHPMTGLPLPRFMGSKHLFTFLPDFSSPRHRQQHGYDQRLCNCHGGADLRFRRYPSIVTGTRAAQVAWKRWEKRQTKILPRVWDSVLAFVYAMARLETI